MNVFTAIMLVFATVGMLDKVAGGRFRLSESFDKGLLTMGTMCIPMVGMSCAGVALIQNNTETIMKVMDTLPFDPSIVAGVLLAPDMGGYFIAEQLSGSKELFVFNGIVLGALLGQMVTFQLPIFLSSIRKEDSSFVLNGFVAGLIVIPVGLVAAAALLGVGSDEFVAEFIPLLLICLLMAAGLMKMPEKTVKGFEIFARGIQIITLILFFITVMGVFVPSAAYSDFSSVEEIVIVVFKSAVIISGSLVLSELILRFFGKWIAVIARKLRVNEISVIGILLGCATSLAVLPLIFKMDDKGKLMNGAFSVSGAYFMGGQMGFVSSVADGYTVAVMVIAKVICGGLGVLLAYKLYGRFSGRGELSEAAEI